MIVAVAVASEVSNPRGQCKCLEEVHDSPLPFHTSARQITVEEDVNKCGGKGVAGYVHREVKGGSEGGNSDEISPDDNVEIIYHGRRWLTFQII